MQEAYEQLEANNGEVVAVSRGDTHGHFFYFESSHHTISELRLEEEHRPFSVDTGGANIHPRFTQQLTVEIKKSYEGEPEKRFCYHLLSPDGISHAIDVNSRTMLQHDTSQDIGPFSTMIDRFLEDFKLLER